MKFGSVPLIEASGAYLAHAVQAGPTRFKKGTLLKSDELETLKGAGIASVIVARLEPGDIGEDEAAAETVTVKTMRSDDFANNQTSVPFDTAVDYLVDQIVGADHDESQCDNPNHIHIHH